MSSRDCQTSCKDHTPCKNGYELGEPRVNTKNSVCAICAKGKGSELASSTTGDHSCQYCWNGQYQDQTGQTGCKNCAKGRYNVATQNHYYDNNYYPPTTFPFLSCAACYKGTYQNQEGQSGCKRLSNR